MAGNRQFIEVLKQTENKVQDTSTEQCFPVRYSWLSEG